MMRQFGDVVGMTGYPEVVLAREAALCYASVCIVTNPACGMAKDRGLCASEIGDLMKICSDSIRKLIYEAAQKNLGERSCRCKDALSNSVL
jgi:5'-methylthioadenosine phosphorylase